MTADRRMKQCSLVRWLRAPTVREGLAASTRLIRQRPRSPSLVAASPRQVLRKCGLSAGRGIACGDGPMGCPQGAAGFLRLSGRALGALADDESDRIHLCDGPIAAATNEGLRQPGSFVDDGLHAGPPGRTPLAAPERVRSDRSCLRWKGIQGWIDGSGERRLTSAHPQHLTISLTVGA